MFLLCFLYLQEVLEALHPASCGMCADYRSSDGWSFLGFAVLDPVFGTSTQTGLVVAIEAILSNAVLIPIGFF